MVLRVQAPYVLIPSSRKQRLRSSPAHSWTPTMPKMKKTKKQRRRTFPSMGRVSNSSVTKIRMPSKLDKKGKEFIRTPVVTRWWTDITHGRRSYPTRDAAATSPLTFIGPVSPRIILLTPSTSINRTEDNTQSDSLTSVGPAGLKVRASRWPALSNLVHCVCRRHVRSGKVRNTVPGVTVMRSVPFDSSG